jgi:hypothetical protein
MSHAEHSIFPTFDELLCMGVPPYPPPPSLSSQTQLHQDYYNYEQKRICNKEVAVKKRSQMK